MPPDAALDLLIVDDDPELRESLDHYLSRAGCQVRICSSGQRALAKLEDRLAEVVISDVRMPGMDGIELLTRLRKAHPHLPVILITAHGDVPQAVAAMQRGAYDFIEKPFAPGRLLDLARRAGEAHRLTRDNRRLRRRLAEASQLERVLVGECPAICRLREDIVDAATVDASVLVLGETGTGKELVARSLHFHGDRRDGPFIAINCAAIPEQLFESTLFGHRAGAFTGAHKASPGHFVAASGGTLFLDEIGSLPMALQPKLLRALQEREVIPVGGSISVNIDIRLVSATNDGLSAMVQDQTFREDLFYRLNTLVLVVPPLRDRGDDILTLFHMFLERLAQRYQIAPPDLTRQDVTALLHHRWPGNVRELEHVAERLLIASRRGRQSSVAEALNMAVPVVSPIKGSLKDRVDEFERHLIVQALEQHKGNMQAVTDALGLPRRTLNEKMARYGLNRSTFM